MPSRASMCCRLQARMCLLFLFSAFSSSVCIISPPLQGETGFFRHCSWIRPQLAHTGSAGLVTRFAGVTSLPWPQNRKQGHTRAFLFFAHALPTFPLRGKGWPVPENAMSRFSRFAHNYPTRLQQGGKPTSLVSFPYPASKTAHRATQGRVWFHRLFLVRFFCGSSASCCSRWQFTASWMGKIV